MGEIADMVLDGTFCEVCGCLVHDGDPKLASKNEIAPGFPRRCFDCTDPEVHTEVVD